MTTYYLLWEQVQIESKARPANTIREPLAFMQVQDRKERFREALSKQKRNLSRASPG